jgi:hypothetical protein
MRYCFFLGFIFFVAICSCKKNKIEEQTVTGSSNSPLTQKPPIADAGPDQIIQLPATWVTIDGSKSIDPNNKPLSYKWRKISGPDDVHYYPSFFQNPQPVQIEIDFYGEGDYVFELTVSNTVGLSATDIVKITIIRAPETAHPIDMVFSINSNCVISGNFPTTVYYSEAYFTLVAASPSSFSGGIASSDIRIGQAYEKYAQDYFSPALLTLSEGSAGLVSFQFYSDLNFFKLPYNGAPASFTDSIFVTSGRGQFANVRHGTRIYCTGTADTTRRTGSIRLQGTIYY